MSPPKTVKRYANRKLYDTERSCYVTLEDISSMIKAGDEVRVVDNKTGDDLTSVTLAQIIFETEKKKSFMPLGLLRNLIREGGDAFDDARERVVGSVQAKADEFKSTATKLKTEFGDRIGGVIPRRSDAEAAGTTGVERRKILGELLKTSQKAFDDLQKGVEERLKAVGSIARPANLDQQMQDIRQRLAELEERLGKLLP
jgi:polyhydroxyalkanoate synthesis repressor PhaR